MKNIEIQKFDQIVIEWIVFDMQNRTIKLLIQTLNDQASV